MFKKYRPYNGSVRGNVFRFYALVALVFSLLLSVPVVWAHKVMIFAWVEGDTVYTQSKFGGGRKAVNSPVLVFDGEGNQLLEGKTDENGEFFFKVPKKTDLKVVLKASMGHLAEWRIPAKEILEADIPGSNPSEIMPEGPAEKKPSVTINNSDKEPSDGQTINLDTQEVHKLLDASLDKKLAPIIKMLADSQDQGPRVTEVIGGIGYIFGLTGVALYFANRRKRNNIK